MSPRSFQAIVTRYLPPTGSRGSRIKATAVAGSIIVHTDHALGIAASHAMAAKALASRMGWGGHWFMGSMPDSSDFCFVCTDGSEAPAFATSPAKAA